MGVRSFWQVAAVPRVIQYYKTCVKWPLSERPKIGFQDQLSLNASQKYCRMLQREHSAILPIFIRLPFVVKSLCCLFLSGRFTQVLLYGSAPFALAFFVSK